MDSKNTIRKWNNNRNDGFSEGSTTFMLTPALHVPERCAF